MNGNKNLFAASHQSDGLLVQHRTDDVQNRKSNAKKHREYIDLVAAYDAENVTDKAESRNDNAPGDAGICFFGLCAILHANDACDKLSNRTGKEQTGREIEQTAAFGSEHCNKRSNTNECDNRQYK